MTELRGLPVANAIKESLLKDIAELKAKEIVPKLAIVRVGENEEDLAYERSIIKRFDAASALVEIVHLPKETNQQSLEDAVIGLNGRDDIHGILVFRPLPGHLSQERLARIIDKRKDVDCMSIENIAGIFAGDSDSFAPCTPRAVIEICHHYGIELCQKNVAVIGRSMVVGKPLSMLLLKENATVTICHTKTKNIESICREADIIVACAGKAAIIGKDHVRSGQIVIDVGINVLDGVLCGDVDYQAVKNVVDAITPVPGGVGTVTASVILSHTVKSATVK